LEWNGLVNLSPEAHLPEGLFIARTLVQDHREVSVRVLNATYHDQKLTKGSAFANCEPVTLVTLHPMSNNHRPETLP
jgi:hypothetical protein